ncbi:MAG TPA: hypothetical protein VK576_07210, partial [Thermoleophilia bacterium]|nr:hypothetical protein [Thermoleophilia bacterium]
MTPFVDFLYFGVLLYPLLPALALGLAGRLGGRVVLAATAFMLVIQYWPAGNGRLRPLWLLLGYAALQLLVVLAFARVRSGGVRRWPFYVALALALAPLVTSRLAVVRAAGWDPGFVGLSYVTFRSLDVIINIQDGVL